MNNLTKITANGIDFKVGNPIQVTWDANSNMNDFKTPGVYEIYGERTVKTDNLPITNDGGGHSIAARLTVVASTLQPANNEICITQFLQLSNRIGGEGNTYIRTYNENNNGLNGWSMWKKQQGMTEVGVDSGLYWMTENGMYSGINTDDYTLQSPTFVETFVLIVINDYAATGKLNQPRHITQLKYAVDAITGQSTVKKRVGTGSDSISWTDWEEIGGGEVDITDAVRTYGLPTLVAQGLAKEGVTYKVVCNTSSVPMMDSANKIATRIIRNATNADDPVILKLSIIKRESNNETTAAIDCYIYGGTGSYFKFMLSFFNSGETVRVSADMTELMAENAQTD